LDILKPLLSFLGLSDSRNPRTPNRHWVKEPKPIDLSSSQREQIERRIAEFIGDSTSVHAHAYAAIARVNALPLLFDWTGFMALRLDGQILWVPYDDDPGEIELVQEERLRNIGLFRGTQFHPKLSFLMPRKPSDAIDCPDCRGTGKIILPPNLEHLSDSLRCYCGGIGWLPHSAMK
jgi:hypothetical protein